jgi:hypothetical protein
MAPGSRAARVRLIGVAGVVALLVFAPWAIRDWLVFGSPLPGQAMTNALSVSGFDIFAWNDPPSVSRYLAVGPARLVEMRVEGLLHNLFQVLLFLGIPVSVVGLVALPWFGRGAALRPLLAFGLVTFLVTSLLFPVATTWGTFLHGGGAVHVLLILSCLLALDAGIARLGRFRGWTRPVAWLGPALTIFGSLLFTAALLPSFGDGSRATRDQYAALVQQLATAGIPLDGETPVITDYPIWLADTTGTPALALPSESPRDVLDLAAAFPRTSLVITHNPVEDDHAWPDVIDAGAPGAECFDELDIGRPSDPNLAAALASTRVFRVVCP